MARITVLGAGLLGSGMVENLLTKGNTVTVWNRSPQKLAPLVAKGAVAAASAAAAVAHAERVHLVLSEDTAVDAVLSDILPSLPAGVPVFDHSTNLPARVAERYPRLRDAGIRYFHAPVFMSPLNARDAGGMMMVAGPTEEVEAWAPALSSMTGKVWHVGERPDLAAIHKLSGNAMLVTMAGVMGDLLTIGAAQGLGPEEVLSVFEHFKPASYPGFIGARVANRGRGPASFELKMARKDVGLMIGSAGGPEALIVLPAVATAMDTALQEGFGDRDFAVFAWPSGR